MTVTAIASPDDPRRRRGAPVDLSTFVEEVDDALTAFRSDVTYAVAMARAAVTITNKRAVWKARRDQRQGGTANAA